MLAICTGFTLNWISQAANQPVEEWRSIAGSLQREWEPGSALIVYPHYADGPIRYYAPEVKADRVIQVWFKATETEIARVDDKIHEMQWEKLPGSHASIFLVVREDQSALDHQDTYDELMDQLKGWYGAPELISMKSSLKLFKYTH